MSKLNRGYLILGVNMVRFEQYMTKFRSKSLKAILIFFKPNQIKPLHFFKPNQIIFFFWFDLVWFISTI